MWRGTLLIARKVDESVIPRAMIWVTTMCSRDLANGSWANPESLAARITSEAIVNMRQWPKECRITEELGRFRSIRPLFEKIIERYARGNGDESD